MGRMTNPAKFLFDVDFSEPEEPIVEAPVEPEIPMMPVAEHETLLEAGRKAAFEEGRAEALKDLTGTQEKLLTDEVQRLVQVCVSVLDQLDEEQASQEKDAVSLAFLVARRLCAHLLARQPLAETVALVSECLGPLRRAPHLVIRVAEKDIEALKTRVDPIVHEKGFDGRLVILGEADMQRGDCHIEWADGGILRDRKALEKQIDGSIRNYLQARSNRASKTHEASGVAAAKEADT
ncbi:FliH/SctL family protein [Labrenzia sp. CE80]|uniref:FliH/SctL family protein n=1 Tax=Labrenzia sp. CE80 TaxID=1788986 RepID=UPI00129A713E|nr:FliH/SctL family protein [Labrenzia sp. CE80]